MALPSTARVPRLARWRVAVAILLALCLSGQGGTRYVVIVNAENPATALDRSFLARAFLKKVTRWPDGSAVDPVDLFAGSATRAQFSRTVLGRSVAAVRNQWQQAIFSGRKVPPPELASDAEVVEYVRRRPGAVGYVSAGTRLEGTRVVEVR